MGYEFHKLYADLVTDDGTVCIFYQAWVRAFGKPRAYGALELYHPTGRREVLHASRPPAYLTRRELDETRDFELELPCGRFCIGFDDALPGWRPSAAPCDGLEWAVTIPRARATARFVDADRPELVGVGYADRATLTRFTRRLGFRALQWGRVHLPLQTMVFNAIDFRDERRWARVARWSAAGAPSVKEEVSLQLSAGTGAVDGLCLSKRRVLHDGSAFDRERIPSAIERALSRTVGGQTEETRWLSEADGSGGSALHEWVRFGAYARATRTARDDPAWRRTREAGQG